MKFFLHIVFNTWPLVLQAILEISETIKFGAPLCNASCQRGESSHPLAVEALKGSEKERSLRTLLIPSSWHWEDMLRSNLTALIE